MIDLVAVLNELVDAKGKILVPGVYDSVKALTEEEKNLYEKIDFCEVTTETFCSSNTHLFSVIHTKNWAHPI